MRPFPTSEKHGAAQDWVLRRVGRVLAAVLAFAVLSAANESWAQEPSKSATAETKKGSKKKKRKSSKSAPRTETVELEEEAPPPPPPKRGSYWGAGDGQESPSTASPPAAATAPAPPTQAAPSAPSRPSTKPESPPSERDLPPSSPADLSSKSGDEPPKAAPAEGAPQGRRLEGSLLAGFGLNRGFCDNQSCNAYGLGLGLRVGTQVVGSVFVGVGATVHLGSSTPRPVANFQRNYTRSVAYAGLEVGYDVPIATLMVRPYAGIGAGYTKKLIVSNLPAEVGNDKQESGHGMGLAAWPGVLVRTMVAGKYPVGIDVRYALMPSAESAISGFGTAGMVF